VWQKSRRVVVTSDAPGEQEIELLPSGMATLMQTPMYVSAGGVLAIVALVASVLAAEVFGLEPF
jgi:hypothetical protein